MPALYIVLHSLPLSCALSPAQVMPFKSFMEGLGLEPESPSLFLTPLPLPPSSSAVSRSRKLLSFLSDSCYLSPSSSSLPPLSPTSPPESLTADDSCSCCSSVDSEPDVLEQSLLDQFSTQRLSASSSASLSPSDQGEEGFAFAQLAPSAVMNPAPCFSLGDPSSSPPAIACPQALDFSSEALEGPHLSYAFQECRPEEEEEEEEGGEFVRTSFHHRLNNSAHSVRSTAVLSGETSLGQATQPLLLPCAISSAHTEPDVRPSEPSTERASTSAASAAAGGSSLLDSLGVDLALLDELPPLDTEPSPSVPSPTDTTDRSLSWRGPTPPAVQSSTPRPSQAGRRATAGLSNKENALSSLEVGSAGLPFGQKSLLAERSAQGGWHLRPALHSLSNVEPGLRLLRGGKGQRKQVSHSDTPRPLKKRAS